MTYARARRHVTLASAVGLLFLSSTNSALSAPPSLPDPIRTPGKADPAVTEANYRPLLCKGSDGKKLHTTDEKRPNSSYTNKIKRRQLSEWAEYNNKTLGAYEEDHLISLELGGSDSDEGNLWPEYWDTGMAPYRNQWGAHVKDGLENELGRRICLPETDSEHLTLIEARQAISGNWIEAYAKYVCTRSKPKRTEIMRAHCSE